jgi:hypothetical protein
MPGTASTEGRGWVRTVKSGALGMRKMEVTSARTFSVAVAVSASIGVPGNFCACNRSKSNHKISATACKNTCCAAAQACACSLEAFPGEAARSLGHLDTANLLVVWPEVVAPLRHAVRLPQSNRPKRLHAFLPFGARMRMHYCRTTRVRLGASARMQSCWEFAMHASM